MTSLHCLLYQITQMQTLTRMTLIPKTYRINFNILTSSCLHLSATRKNRQNAIILHHLSQRHETGNRVELPVLSYFLLWLFLDVSSSSKFPFRPCLSFQCIPPIIYRLYFRGTADYGVMSVQASCHLFNSILENSIPHAVYLKLNTQVIHCLCKVLVRNSFVCASHSKQNTQASCHLFKYLLKNLKCPVTIAVTVKLCFCFCCYC